MEPVLTTEIGGLARYATGKVRDVYDLGDRLLIVATDRISAFDVVMPNGIPGKGETLTRLSRYWFRQLGAIVPTHYISSDQAAILAAIVAAGGRIGPGAEAALGGRSMLTVKADPFPVECVVRGYIAGSLWQEYREAGGERSPVQLHGIELPGGLRESERLPQPIFTPATKATSGHDENIGQAEAEAILGAERGRQVAQLSIELYGCAAELALERGIIIADTKFEFGIHNGEVILIDEALTPDSSRFWDAEQYEPGRSQASFDKQYVRDWLLQSGWNREPPAPTLPPEVVEGTARRYREALERITGELAE